ncbi:MAG: hypothetical protein KAI75_10150, partial [Desulfobulbaceae bacterium]|nr:hypothetical protein [Desulfobulbaceae bacterium]
VLELTSEGQNDQIGISYSPDYLRNHRTDEYGVKHNAGISVDKDFSSRLRASISDDFRYVDNPPREARINETIEMRFVRAEEHYRTEIVRILFPEITWAPDQMDYVLSELSQRYNNATATEQAEVNNLLPPTVTDTERRRHWTNSLSFSTEYEFAKDSLLSLGYSYNIQEDKTADVEDSRSHNPNVSLSYRFNHQWQAKAAYSYKKDTYDNSSDRETHDLDYSVDFQATTSNHLTADYSISTLDYEETALSDQTTQRGGLSWDHTFDPKTSFSASADGSYKARVAGSDDRGYGVDLNLSREIDQGEFSFGTGYNYTETDNSGTWDDLNESWSLSGGGSYQLLADLSSDLDLSYEKRYAWSGGTKNTYDNYSGGVGLTWSFAQWYALSLNYDYSRTETDSAGLDDYDNHKIFA